MSIFRDLKGLASKSVVYGLGSVLLRSISLFLLPLYTRYLTPADYGITGVVAAITSVLGFVMTLGLNGALTRFHFSAATEEDRKANNGTIMMTMIGFAVLLALLLDFSGSHLTSFGLSRIPFHPYIRIAIWTAVFNMLVLFPQITFQVREKPMQYVAVSVTGVLVTIACLVWFVAFRREGALGYLKGNLYAAMILAVPYLWITARHAVLAFRRTMFIAALGYALPLVPHQLGGWLLDVSDRLILERYTPLPDVGLYSLGYQFGLIMYIGAMSINQAWIPFFFRRVEQKGDAAKPEIAGLVTYFALALCLMALAIASLSQEALAVLVTPPFRRAYSVVPWITAAYLCCGLYFIPGNFVFVTKRTRLVPIPTFVAGIVNIAANLFLVPRYGMMAACWTTFGSFVLMLVMFWAIARRVYPFPYEYARLAAILCMTVVLFVIARSLSFPWIAVQIALKILIVIALPCLLFLFLASEQEHAAVSRMFGRIAGERPQPER